MDSSSTNRLDRSGASQALHHPLGKQHWPNMFEEARDMLDSKFANVPLVESIL
jgi:hypothetical protein